MVNELYILWLKYYIHIMVNELYNFIYILRIQHGPVIQYVSIIINIIYYPIIVPIHIPF